MSRQDEVAPNQNPSNHHTHTLALRMRAPPASGAFKGSVDDDDVLETPPLSLLVLDGLADDLESLGTLRDHGEVEPYGLALFDEPAVLGALRELLSEGLVEAWEVSGAPVRLVRCPAPSDDDPSLRRYWFKWTPEGERAWRQGQSALDAYYERHSPGG
jgi:hypothetical protein